MRRLVLATTNPGKVRELRLLLEGAPLAVTSLADLPHMDDPEETGVTFADNARLKALHYAGAITGLVMSEDSGLVIDELDGEPGVQSARFLAPDATYPERFAEILRRLDGVPDTRRTARFVCALAVAEGTRVLFEAEGRVEGRIARAPAGTGGFGYDPIFFSAELGGTLAEVGDAKAAVSHRGHAVRALARWIDDLK